MSLESKIAAIHKAIAKQEKEREKYLALADDTQSQIDQLHQQKAEVAQSALQAMGLKVVASRPSLRKRTEPTCSICVDKGLSGLGHTAARHHRLVIRGELTIPDIPVTKGLE